MSEPIAITRRAGPEGRAPLALEPRWRAAHLLLAPHRLGFFLAMLVLMGAGAWWLLVQLDRVSGLLSLPYALSPSLVHGAVMTFGFLPLFFSGFLFTAGPKWLAVASPAARQVLAPLLLQASGWLLWLAGAHLHGLTALVGLVLACTGLSWVTLMFWRLIGRSQAGDQLHARSVGVACAVGCLSLAGGGAQSFSGRAVGGAGLGAHRPLGLCGGGVHGGGAPNDSVFYLQRDAVDSRVAAVLGAVADAGRCRR